MEQGPLTCAHCSSTKRSTPRGQLAFLLAPQWTIDARGASVGRVAYHINLSPLLSMSSVWSRACVRNDASIVYPQNLFNDVSTLQ